MPKKIDELTWEKLFQVQQLLQVPKANHNGFDGYDYRSLEDIMQALKPLQKELKFVLLFQDKIQLIGERYYLQAEAKFIDYENDSSISVRAYAREEELHQRMDPAQITGAASSYARKYAANALFEINDVKDADSLAGTGASSTQAEKAKRESNPSWKQKLVKHLGGVTAARNYIKKETGKDKITQKEAKQLYQRLSKQGHQKKIKRSA